MKLTHVTKEKQHNGRQREWTCEVNKDEARRKQTSYQSKYQLFTSIDQIIYTQIGNQVIDAK